jgi:hypothetical protein
MRFAAQFSHEIAVMRCHACLDVIRCLDDCCILL